MACFFRVGLLLVVAQVTAVRLTRGQLIGGCCAAAVPLACEAYSRAPPSWSAADLPSLFINSNAETLVIVLHGSGGPDANVARITKSLQSSNTAVVEYDWSAYVGDQLQGPFNAKRIGSHLADEIQASGKPLKRLHVVGISVGAFAADALVTRFTSRRARRSAGTHVKLTLLDPFTARGLPGLIRPGTAYGVATFGRTADVAQCVINTDDPVPSTSLPLVHAVNFDITDCAERTGFVPLEGDSLHSWPAAWYGFHPTALEEAGRGLARGAVVAIP